MMLEIRKIFLWLLPIVLIATPFALPQDEDPPKQEASDPKAVRFLKEAESRMYRPAKEGLQSLSLSMPLATPMGKLGAIKFWFKAPDRYQYKILFDPGTPQAEELSRLPPDQRRIEDFESSELMRMTLGTFLTHGLDQYVVKFLDTKDDTRRLRLTAKPGTPLARRIHSRDYIFNAEGLIESIKDINAQGRTEDQRIYLKKLKGADLYLVDRAEKKLIMPQGTTKSVQSFQYEEVKGYHLLRRIVTEIPAVNMKYPQEITDLKLNEPIEDKIFTDKAGQVEIGK